MGVADGGATKDPMTRPITSSATMTKLTSQKSRCDVLGFWRLDLLKVVFLLMSLGTDLVRRQDALILCAGVTFRLPAHYATLCLRASIRTLCVDASPIFCYNDAG